MLGIPFALSLPDLIMVDTIVAKEAGSFVAPDKATITVL